MIHGLASSPATLEPLAKFLAQKGLTVFGVRLAGHDTSPEDLFKTSSRDWLASAEKALEELKKETKEIFLIGYSFGASLALKLAFKNPELISGLVLVSPPIYLRHHWPKKITTRLLKILKLKKFYHKPWVKKEISEVYLKEGRYSKIPVKALDDFFKFIAQSRREAPKIKTPVFIIHSKDDRVVAPESADWLFSKLPGHKKLTWLSQIDHSELNRKELPELFQDIFDFIVSESRE